MEKFTPTSNKTFGPYTHNTAVDFVDSEGYRVTSFQLVNKDGYSESILDYDDGYVRRMADTKSANHYFAEWQDYCEKVLKTTEPLRF